jgi:hypothetical protein
VKAPFLSVHISIWWLTILIPATFLSSYITPTTEQLLQLLRNIQVWNYVTSHYA